MKTQSYEIKLSERDFSKQVEDLFKLFGWEFYHVVEQHYYARRTSRGFPDYVAVKPPRLIFAELKSEKGQLTEAQEKWLEILKQCQHIFPYIPNKMILTLEDEVDTSIPKIMLPEVYLWRPSQIEEIAEVLR